MLACSFDSFQKTATHRTSSQKENVFLNFFIYFHFHFKSPPSVHSTYFISDSLLAVWNPLYRHLNDSSNLLNELKIYKCVKFSNDEVQFNVLFAHSSNRWDWNMICNLRRFYQLKFNAYWSQFNKLAFGSYFKQKKKPSKKYYVKSNFLNFLKEQKR